MWNNLYLFLLQNKETHHFWAYQINQENYNHNKDVILLSIYPCYFLSKNYICSHFSQMHKNTLAMKKVKLLISKYKYATFHFHKRIKKNFLLLLISNVFHESFAISLENSHLEFCQNCSWLRLLFFHDFCIFLWMLFHLFRLLLKSKFLCSQLHCVAVIKYIHEEHLFRVEFQRFQSCRSLWSAKKCLLDFDESLSWDSMIQEFWECVKRQL